MKEEAGANAKARRITAKMRAEWARELDEVGQLFCPMIGCFKKFVTVANFQTHYKWCTGKTDLQKCLYCDSLIITAHKSFYQHMKAYHPDKVEDHKNEDAIYDPDEDPSSSFVTTDDDASLVMHVEEVTESPVKYQRTRKASLKENNQTVWKHKMKSINEAAIKNIDQFQKCVRFNSIVDKINSVDEVVHTIEELQEATTIRTQRTPKKSKNIVPQNVIENELYFEDPDDSADEPSIDSEVVQRTPKTGTKSVFVLDNEYYKRYHENLTMTRDWSSARKTYTRSRNSNSMGESKFCSQMLNDSSQDGQNMNEFSDSTGFQQVLELQHSDHSTSNPSLSSDDRLQLTENLAPKDLILPLDPKNVDYNLEIIATEEACIDLIMNPDDAKSVKSYKENNESESKTILNQRKFINPVKSLSFEDADFKEDFNQINTFRKKSLELRPIITYGERVVEEQVVTPRNTTVDFNDLLKNVKTSRTENDSLNLITSNKYSGRFLKPVGNFQRNKAKISAKGLNYYRTKHSKTKHFNKSKLNVLTLFSCKAAKKRRLNKSNKKFSKFYRQSKYASAESAQISCSDTKQANKMVKHDTIGKSFKRTKQMNLHNTNKTYKFPLKKAITEKKANSNSTRTESIPSYSATAKYKSFSEVSDFLYEQSAASYNKVISNVILDCETTLIDYQEMGELCAPEISENLNYAESNVTSETVIEASKNLNSEENTVSPEITPKTTENLNYVESINTSEARDSNKFCNSHSSISHEQIETVSHNESQVQNVTDQANICKEIIKEVQIISGTKTNVEAFDQDKIKKSDLGCTQENNSSVESKTLNDSLNLSESNITEKTNFHEPEACQNIADSSLNENKTDNIDTDLLICKDTPTKAKEVMFQQTNNAEKSVEIINHPTGQDMDCDTVVSSMLVDTCSDSEKVALSTEKNFLVIEKDENSSKTSGNYSIRDISETTLLSDNKVNAEVEDALKNSVCIDQIKLSTDKSMPHTSNDDFSEKALHNQPGTETQISTTLNVNSESTSYVLSTVVDERNKGREIKHNETLNENNKICLVMDPQPTVSCLSIQSDNTSAEISVKAAVTNSVEILSSNVSNSSESVIEKIGENCSDKSNSKNVAAAKDVMNVETNLSSIDEKSKDKESVGKKGIHKDDEIVTNLNSSQTKLEETALAENSLSASTSNSCLTNDRISVELNTSQTVRKRGRPRKEKKKDICKGDRTEKNEIEAGICKKTEAVKNLNLSIELREGELIEHLPSTLVCNSSLTGEVINGEISTPQIIKKRGRRKKELVNNVTNTEALSSNDTASVKVSTFLSPTDSAITSSRKSARIRSRKESMKQLDADNDILNTEKLELIRSKEVSSDLKSIDREVEHEIKENFINRDKLYEDVETDLVSEHKVKSSSVMLSPNLHRDSGLSEKSFTSELDSSLNLPTKAKKRGRPRKYPSPTFDIVSEKTGLYLNSNAIKHPETSFKLSGSEVCDKANIGESLNKANSSFTEESNAVFEENDLLTKKADVKILDQSGTPKKKRGRPRKYPLKEQSNELLNSVPSNKIESNSHIVSSKRRGRKKQKLDSHVLSFNNADVSERNDYSFLANVTQLHDPNFRKSPRKGQPKKCARYAYINSTVENCDQLVEDSDFEEKTVLLPKSGKRKGIKRKRESDLSPEQTPSETSSVEDMVISGSSNVLMEGVTLPPKQSRISDTSYSGKPNRRNFHDKSINRLYNKVLKVGSDSSFEIVPDSEDDFSMTSVSNFIQKQEKLFLRFKPKKCLWKALSESEQVQYYPPLIKSMPVRPKSNQNDVELACFESVTLSDKRDFAFFTGAPIWSSAWCPTPIDKKAHQYLALATSGSLANYYSFTANNDGRSLIQLWNMGFLQTFDLEQTPALQLCLVFNYGNIFDMAWCPYGCWEDPDQDGDMSRLGLLAVASSDAFIRIYSIPHPNFTNSDASSFPLYDVSPSAVLKPLYSAPGTITEKSACITLHWEKTGKCERIAAGYGNGYICVWMLNSSSSLLTGNEENVYVPHLLFRSHSTPVTAVAFANLSKSQWLVSTGFEKEVKFWNLNDTSLPVATVKDGYASNVEWGAQCCGAFITNHDSVSFRASHFLREFELETSVATCMDDCNITTKKSAYSEPMNAIAVSDENGTITAKILHTLHGLHPSSLEKFPRRKSHAGKAVIPPLKDVDKTAEPFINYQDLAVNTISWNPNHSSRFWLLAGGSSGVARLSCLHDLKIDDAIS